jgi:hypothetical protein
MTLIRMRAGVNGVVITRPDGTGAGGELRYGVDKKDKYITGYIIRTMRGRRAAHILKPR